jgi:hypothetical protein
MAASLIPAPRKDQRDNFQHSNKLCYDNYMTYWRTIPLLLALLAGIAPLPAFAQSSGDGLAEELNILRQERRQLEKDIDQYENSIELLQDSDKDQAAVESEQAELEIRIRMSQRQQLAHIEREAEILDLLPRQTRSPEPVDTGADDSEAAELAKLKKLLEAHATRAAAAATADNPAFVSPGSSVSAMHKVKLNGSESVAVIESINRRLAGASISSQRREADVIFHVETRLHGKLRSSRSYNLKALGRSQYIAKVSLMAGSAVISVRRDKWEVDLGEQEASDYLITLNLSRGAEPELHVIPVEELKATQWTQVPAWLPQIGIVATTPAS